MCRQFLLVGLSLCLSVTLARASMITASFDPQGTVCEVTQLYHTIGRLYLLALLYDDAAVAGIQGAEFRLDGFPPDWFTTITPNPAASVILGNPLVGRCAIGFDACQTPAPPAAVVLYTIDYAALSAVSNRVLTVRGTQTCQFCYAPLVTLGDAPVYSKILVTGGQAALNFPGFCTVAAAPRS
jgi:hypothetical protein